MPATVISLPKVSLSAWLFINLLSLLTNIALCICSAFFKVWIVPDSVENILSQQALSYFKGQYSEELNVNIKSASVLNILYWTSFFLTWNVNMTLLTSFFSCLLIWLNNFYVVFPLSLSTIFWSYTQLSTNTNMKKKGSKFPSNFALGYTGITTGSLFFLFSSVSLFLQVIFKQNGTIYCSSITEVIWECSSWVTGFDCKYERLWKQLTRVKVSICPLKS